MQLEYKEQSNYVDIKVTVWQRLVFTDEADMQKILSLLKKEGTEAITEDELGYVDYKTLLDTEKTLTPAQNEGAPTIEVFQRGTCIWLNSPENTQ